MLFEGARTCPFSHQFRVRTAFWVANKVQNDVIQISLQEYSKEILYLQDRGLFDAMSFIKLLEYEPIKDEEDRNIFNNLTKNNGIKQFLTYLANWARYVDLVILVETRPEIAVKRDLASKMNSGPGMITNLETLRILETAYKTVIDEFGSSFPRIEIVRTIDGEPLKTAVKIRELINDVNPSFK